MGSSPFEQIPQGIDPCQQLRNTIITEHWALEITLIGTQQHMQEALLDSHSFAVSDGSFKEETGAVVWIIEGRLLETRIIRKWYTPGQAPNHSSFQSKLAGIVGVLYTLTFWKPMQHAPQLCLACNGLSVISQLHVPQPIEPSEPHADLLRAAQTLLNSCGYQVQLVSSVDTKTMGIQWSFPGRHG